MPRITKRLVDASKVNPGRDVIVWDDDLRGFGLRVSRGGVRSYVVQYRVAGRSRRLTIGRHGELTPEEARRKAARDLLDAREGRDPAATRAAAHAEPQSPSLRDLAARYLTEHAEPKKKTAGEDRRLLEGRILPELGSLTVAELTSADVARFHHGMRATPFRANRALSLLSKMMHLAEVWGLRPEQSNPCRHVERFRERKRERFLSAAELARLGDVLAAAERDGTEPAEVVAALRLLIFTGARSSEILELRWEWVDLERSCLRLPESKTGAKTVPLSAPAREVLAGLERRAALVLPSAEPDRPLSLWRPWDRIRKRAGLSDVRVHDLRHTFASILASSGTSLLVIGRVLGHTVPATTARYAHLSDDPVREAAETAGARLAAAMGSSKGGDVVSLAQEAPATRAGRKEPR